MIFGTTNRKGGATKTTLAVNLAASWAPTLRVLLVDLDEQGDASEWLGVGGAGTELAAALQGRGPITDAVRQASCGVDVAVGGEALSHVSESLDRFALRRALAEVTEVYDVIVVDCPPGLGPAVRAGWLAGPAVRALVPVDGPEALRATGRLLHAWQDLGLDGSAVRVVLSRQNPRRLLDQALRKQARQLNVPVIGTSIRESVVVRESAGWRSPLMEYDPDHPVAGDFKRVAEEVLRA